MGNGPHAQKGPAMYIDISLFQAYPLLALLIPVAVGLVATLLARVL